MTISPTDLALLTRLDATAHLERVPFDGGGRMAWRRFGSEGPPLVLLHGGHGAWLHWARNIEALAVRYTVWVPDLPGYGDSDTPQGTSIDALVDATLQCLDAVAGRGTALRLAGFSFGSVVSAHLAARRGGVSHLALLGPAGHGGPRRPRGELRAWRELTPHSEAFEAVMRHNLLMHMLHDPAAIDAAALRIHGEACLHTRFHSKSIARSTAMPQLLDRHAGELLLAWGEHDVTLEPAFAADALGKGRARCRIHGEPDAGHWVQYEAAEAVNRLLLDWLAGAVG